MTKILRTTMAAALAVATLGLINVQPARADGAASTRNIVLGAAALVAGIAIESNVAHRNAEADTIQGYLPNGEAVYQDGHVALPNGQSYYPGNYGQTVACNDGACTISGGNGTGYYGYGSHGGYSSEGAGAGYASGTLNRLGYGNAARTREGDSR